MPSTGHLGCGGLRLGEARNPAKSSQTARRATTITCPTAGRTTAWSRVATATIPTTTATPAATARRAVASGWFCASSPIAATSRACRDPRVVAAIDHRVVVNPGHVFGKCDRSVDARLPRVEPRGDVFVDSDRPGTGSDDGVFDDLVECPVVWQRETEVAAIARRHVAYEAAFGVSLRRHDPACVPGRVDANLLATAEIREGIGDAMEVWHNGGVHLSVVRIKSTA